MRNLWNSIGPAAQGAVIGVLIMFCIPPLLWVLWQWWGLFFVIGGGR